MERRGSEERSGSEEPASLPLAYSDRRRDAIKLRSGGEARWRDAILVSRPNRGEAISLRSGGGFYWAGNWETTWARGRQI